MAPALSWQPARVFVTASAPIDTRLLLTGPLYSRSLGGNKIGNEGASALAAVLKETQITTLKCAAASECSLLCQRPLTRLLSHIILSSLLLFHSLGGNVSRSGAIWLRVRRSMGDPRRSRSQTGSQVPCCIIL